MKHTGRWGDVDAFWWGYVTGEGKSFFPSFQKQFLLVVKSVLIIKEISSEYDDGRRVWSTYMGHIQYEKRERERQKKKIHESFGSEDYVICANSITKQKDSQSHVYNFHCYWPPTFIVSSLPYHFYRLENGAPKSVHNVHGFI